MKTKDFALQVKDLAEDGTFEGYGSIFGNTDSYGEVVDPGAFAASLAKHRREGTSPVMLWQHDTHSPIGVWSDLVEDGKGLKGTGRLLTGSVAKASETHALLKAGAIRGLSIGYREVKVEPDGNVRRLKELDLLEISVVTFPANRRANVTSVKELLEGGQLPSIREFEDFLRDAGGFSKSVAAAIAGKAAPHLRGDPEAEGDPLAAFWAALRDAEIIDLTGEPD